jgi:hypothetical protein
MIERAELLRRQQGYYRELKRRNLVISVVSVTALIAPLMAGVLLESNLAN